MSRLYAFASTPTLTSAKADHAVPRKASAMGSVLAAIAAIAGMVANFHVVVERNAPPEPPAPPPTVS